MSLFEDQIRRVLGVFEHKNNVCDHFYCVKEIISMYNTKEDLEKLAAKPDLDTICAYDYNRMRNFALQGNGLHLIDWFHLTDSWSHCLVQMQI